MSRIGRSTITRMLPIVAFLVPIPQKWKRLRMTLAKRAVRFGALAIERIGGHDHPSRA